MIFTDSKNIGIYGGTFDPIHIGHLRLAIEARNLLNLDEVHLIPCALPPHRMQPLFSAEQRLQMVRLACKQIDGLIANNYEIKSAKYSQNPSYTINTLINFRQNYPNSKIFLLLGSDSFANLTSWKSFHQFLDLANLAVINRPNQNPYNLTIRNFLTKNKANLAEIQNLKNGKIVELNNVPKLDISATQIRTYLQKNLPIDFLVPNNIKNFIAKSA